MRLCDSIMMINVKNIERKQPRFVCLSMELHSMLKFVWDWNAKYETSFNSHEQVKTKRKCYWLYSPLTFTIGAFCRSFSMVACDPKITQRPEGYRLDSLRHDYCKTNTWYQTTHFVLSCSWYPKSICFCNTWWQIAAPN